MENHRSLIGPDSLPISQPAEEGSQEYFAQFFEASYLKLRRTVDSNHLPSVKAYIDKDAELGDMATDYIDMQRDSGDWKYEGADYVSLAAELLRKEALEQCKNTIKKGANGSRAIVLLEEVAAYANLTSMHALNTASYAGCSLHEIVSDAKRKIIGPLAFTKYLQVVSQYLTVTGESEEDFVLHPGTTISHDAYLRHPTQANKLATVGALGVVDFAMFGEQSQASAQRNAPEIARKLEKPGGQLLKVFGAHQEDIRAALQTTNRTPDQEAIVAIVKEAFDRNQHTLAVFTGMRGNPRTLIQTYRGLSEREKHAKDDERETYKQWKQYTEDTSYSFESSYDSPLPVSELDEVRTDSQGETTIFPKQDVGKLTLQKLSQETLEAYSSVCSAVVQPKEKPVTYGVLQEPTSLSIERDERKGHQYTVKAEWSFGEDLNPVLLGIKLDLSKNDGIRSKQSDVPYFDWNIPTHPDDEDVQPLRESCELMAKAALHQLVEKAKNTRAEKSKSKQQVEPPPTTVKQPKVHVIDPVVRMRREVKDEAKKQLQEELRQLQQQRLGRK